MRKLIIILLFTIGFQSFSQEDTIEEIDAQTYTLFLAEQWKELIVYGTENPQDFYYFNVRMGIAYFYEREYHSSEKYLKKAIAQESTDFAIEYLFWSYYNLGESYLAELEYDQLSEDAKKSIDYKKTAIESVYLEVGLKSPNTNDVENTYYGNFILKHRIGKNIRLLHSVNTFIQEQSVQDFNSFQYHISGSYLFNTSALSVGAIFNSSEFNLASNEVIKDDFNNNILVDFTSNDKGNTYSFYANFNKRFNRLRINANINYVAQNSTVKTNTKVFLESDGSPISEDKTKIKTTKSVYIPAIGISYTPSFTRDRVNIGADFFIPITEEETNFVFKPYLNVFILDQLWVNTSYLQVEDYLFADYSSEILYNTPDLVVNRFVTTINYAFSKRIITKFTYTFENYNFTSVDLNYDINSVFLGIQYKF